MSTIHLHRTTTATPEQYIAGLTDFGPGRSKLFGNSADGTLRCIIKAPCRPTSRKARTASGNACTTTGPSPDRVVLTTTDSNVWGGASGHTYTFTRRPDGTTDIDVAVVRDGKNLKGWLLGFLHRAPLVGRVLESAFEKSVKAIEARQYLEAPRDRGRASVKPRSAWRSGGFSSARTRFSRGAEKSRKARTLIGRNRLAVYTRLTGNAGVELIQQRCQGPAFQSRVK